ncbi:MAG TPA: hypothetical protein VMC84_03925 [Methanocella sp.]|uniref:hypothetical protein n=1 Tax=Methanocella sp. TaxID=2052833 RepID=UPI002C7A2EBC|nr:hypothetical protein [Methanocella sp.]HTY90302.1 hypothetical protein [Methanocella sp.]
MIGWTATIINFSSTIENAILEKGIGQPEAIALYENSRYRRIDNYGPYANDPESIHMAKELSKSDLTPWSWSS